MKKIISVILIILLAFNFIFFNTAYAEGDESKTKMQNTYTGKYILWRKRTDRRSYNICYK